MTRKIKPLIVGIITAMVTWLLLSYIFFPIKLSAPADAYFMATIGHMIPLKAFITIVLVLFAVFLYEQHIKKNKKH